LSIGAILKFTNPASGEDFGSVPMATPTQVAQTVVEMKAAQRVWGRKSVPERVRILRKLQAVIVDAVDEISYVVGQDTGKNRQDVLIEIFTTLDKLNVNLKYARTWLQTERVPRGFLFFQRLYSVPRPFGCVAVISPWNYPFVLSVPPVFTALLAGNTVVLKPSEVSPATGVVIEKLFQRVPELAPFVRVLHGDGSVGADLIQNHPDFIFLTGSTSTGKAIMKAASENLIPIVCELGGKDAMIILEDADLDAAARWGVWGSFFNAGQVCMSIERLYVVESVYERFLEKIVAETRKLSVGYSRNLDSPYHCGPLTDPKQLQVIQSHLQDALAKRARRLAGEIQTGSVVVNDVMVQFGAPLLPFGGTKASGFGRIHGKAGLLAFTQSFAYVEGWPPRAYDLATIVRSPGRYKLFAAIIGLIFGVTLRQKAGTLLKKRI
jgi:acyl-CoA reductase-like NAD-dependent aldehyde dehydrogenase